MSRVGTEIYWVLSIGAVLLLALTLFSCGSPDVGGEVNAKDLVARLRVGMSIAEVDALTDSQPAVAGTPGEYEQWSFQDSETGMLLWLSFVNGKLSRARFVTNQVGPDGELVKENIPLKSAPEQPEALDSSL